MSQVSIIDIESNHPQIPTRFDANVSFAIPIANVLEIYGDTTAAGTSPVHTVGSGNNITTYVQISQAIAASNATNIGLSAFNSSQFTVDANGFVSIAGGATAESFNVDAATAPGTDPVLPNGSGVVTVTGAQVAAGTVGTNVIRTNSLAANTYTIEIQRSSAQAASTVAANGVAHFDSAAFDVDANGFVQLNGGGIAATSFDVQANTAPGTDPVVPTAAGVVTVNGAAVANHSVVLETRSRAANAYNLEVQYATSAAATDATKSGVAHFNSTQFSVDASGFVALAGGGQAIDSIGTQTGTNPIAPTAAGLVTINGAVVAAGTNPVRSDGTGANTMAIEVQISQALAAADATKIGLSNFDSSSFAVAATGFVTLSTTGVLKTLTGNTGGAISPTANNINTLGTGSITISGSGSTLTTQLTGITNHAIQIGAGTATLTQLSIGSTGQVLQANSAADPTWSTATFPSTATSTGTILRADGTNWVATTSTYPNTNAVSTLLYASSANVMSALATTNRASLSTNSTGVPTWLALTDGQIVVGSSAGSPAAANITSTGGTVTVTNGSNTINLEVTTGGFTWTDVTTATQAMSVENGYITDRSAGVVYTLPATAVLGAEIIVMGKLGITTITPNANQQILMSSASGTVGVTGTAVGTNVGDCITLIATTSGSSTVWRAESFVGNWTLS